MRQPKNNEMFCKFGCKTIVDKSLGSCEMCCFEAISERSNRYALCVQKPLSTVKNTLSVEDAPEVVEPTPKRRGRPAKEA